MNCAHLDSIAVDRLGEADKTGAVCGECVERGDRWVHLRQCRTCGAIGCCDDSPNQHARKHFLGQGHPIITSAEPREIWSYCFVDDLLLPRGS